MNKKSIPKIVFLTGTRADLGKMKSLMLQVQRDMYFETHIFVTGMHMLSKYGSTWDEVRKIGLNNIYKFINQNIDDSMDQILAKTISGLSDYVKEIRPDLLIIHGDRVEALAGAIVGVLNCVRVAHIEGGEVSGTVDESIRHAISKFSHIHLVSNKTAKKRLIQLGEAVDSIHVIGSPEVDCINSNSLPDISIVKDYYKFSFEKYAVLIFHPVTTELENLYDQIKIVVDAVLEANLNFVVIYPNNDHGTEIILHEYIRFRDKPNVAVYPSMRFEYFLSLLKYAQFIIGNSSSGVREAPIFGVPTINLGSRQHNRSISSSIINISIEKQAILEAFTQVMRIPRVAQKLFGDGKSAEKFHLLLKEKYFWNINIQKYFVDLTSDMVVI